MSEATIAQSTSVPAPAPEPVPEAWDYRNDKIDSYTLEQVDNNLEASIGYDVNDKQLQSALGGKTSEISDYDLGVLDGANDDGQLTKSELQKDNDEAGPDKTVAVTEKSWDYRKDGIKSYTLAQVDNSLETSLGYDVDEKQLQTALGKDKNIRDKDLDVLDGWKSDDGKLTKSELQTDSDGERGADKKVAVTEKSWDFKGDGISNYTFEQVDNPLETIHGYTVDDAGLKAALSASAGAIKDLYSDADLERLDGSRSSDGKLTERELETDNGVRDAKVNVSDLDIDKTYTVSSYARKLEGKGKNIDERGLLELLNDARLDNEQLTFTSAFTETEAKEDLRDISLDPSDIDEIRQAAKEAASDNGNTARVNYKGTWNDYTVGTLAASAEKALTDAGYTGQKANIDESGLASIFGKKSLDGKIEDYRIANKFDSGQDDGVLDIFEIQEMQRQAKAKGTSTDSKLIDKDAQWDYDVKAGVDTYTANQFKDKVKEATGLEVDTANTLYKTMINDGTITETELRNQLDTLVKDGYLSEKELETITKKGFSYSGDGTLSYSENEFLAEINKTVDPNKKITDIKADQLDTYFGNGTSGSFTTKAKDGLTDREILDSRLDANDDGILNFSELSNIPKSKPAPVVLDYSKANTQYQLLGALETALGLSRDIDMGKLKNALGLKDNLSTDAIKAAIAKFNTDGQAGLTQAELEKLKAEYNKSVPTAPIGRTTPIPTPRPTPVLFNYNKLDLTSWSYSSLQMLENALERLWDTNLDPKKLKKALGLQNIKNPTAEQIRDALDRKFDNGAAGLDKAELAKLKKECDIDSRSVIGRRPKGWDKIRVMS